MGNVVGCFAVEDNGSKVVEMPLDSYYEEEMLRLRRDQDGSSKKKDEGSRLWLGGFRNSIDMEVIQETELDAIDPISSSFDDRAVESKEAIKVNESSDRAYLERPPSQFSRSLRSLFENPFSGSDRLQHDSSSVTVSSINSLSSSSANRYAQKKDSWDLNPKRSKSKKALELRAQNSIWRRLESFQVGDNSERAGKNSTRASIEMPRNISRPRDLSFSQDARSTSDVSIDESWPALPSQNLIVV